MAIWETANNKGGASGGSEHQPDNFIVQADAAALDAWSLANPSLLTDDMVALIKSDDDGVSAWLQYDTSLSDWKYIDASGVVVEDEFGAPVSLRKVKLSPEFELISAPGGDGVGEISISQFMKNTAPVTTFLVASGLNRVIQAGETVDIFQDFYSSFTEQFVASTGAEILGFSGLPFTRFAGTQGRIRFPDMERTSKGVIDISEVAISCRVSGTFVGNLDSTVSVDYFMIGNSGEPNTRLAVMAFERQFNLDFTARAQSLVSRLSKKTSTLVQNGAKFFIKVPPDAPSSFTLTGIDFLITVGR